MLKKKTLLIIPFVLIMTFIITMMTPICVYADNAYYPQENALSDTQFSASNNLYSIEIK